MKNVWYSVFSIGMLAFTSVLPVQAYGIDEVWNPCEYSSQEVWFVEIVRDALYDHASSRIVAQFTTQSYKDLIEIYTQEYIDDLTSVLSVCRDKNTASYDWTHPMTLEELTDSLRMYAQVIKTLMILETTGEEQNIVGEHMQTLQNILLWEDLVQYFDTNTFLASSSDIGFDVVFSAEEVHIDAWLAIVSEQVGDVRWTQVDSEQSFDLVVEADTQDMWIFSVDMAMDMMVRVVDGHLFVQMDNVALDTDWLPEEVGMQVRAVQETMDLISGKWIDVWWFIEWSLDIVWWSWLPFDQLMQQPQKLLTQMLDQSMIIQYSKDGALYFWWLNPSLCALAPLFQAGVRECLEDMWYEQYIWSQGKWFILMEIHEDGYTVGITDRYMREEDKMTGEEANIYNNKPLVWWNDTWIVFIDIPFGEVWWFMYEDGVIDITADIPEQRYDWETDSYKNSSTKVRFSGTADTQNHILELAGTVVWKDMEIDFDRKHTWTLDAMDATMWLRFAMTDEYNPFELTIAMDLTTQQDEIQPISVSVPDDSDVVDLETILALVQPDPIFLDPASEPVFVEPPVDIIEDVPPPVIVSDLKNNMFDLVERDTLADFYGSVFIDGNASAPISLIEFSDFQCPFCQRFSNAETLQQVRETYGDDKVNIVFAHFPLGFHANAQKAAESYECVWSLHWKDAALQFKKKYFAAWWDASLANAENILTGLWYDVWPVMACVEAWTMYDRVQQHMKVGMLLGISGTPWTLVVDNKTWDFVKVSGAVPASSFDVPINNILSQYE